MPTCRKAHNTDPLRVQFPLYSVVSYYLYCSHSIPHWHGIIGLAIDGERKPVFQHKSSNSRCIQSFRKILTFPVPGKDPIATARTNQDTDIRPVFPGRKID